MDKDGNPTNDPNDYAAGGAILPVGADQGHKGFGLSFMVEMFSGLLTGLGFGIDPQARHNDGCFLAVFDVAKFRPLEDFKQEMTEFAEFVKTSPPAPGFSEVYYPGEIEYRTELQRRGKRHLHRGRNLASDIRSDGRGRRDRSRGAARSAVTMVKELHPVIARRVPTGQSRRGECRRSPDEVCHAALTVT